MKKSHTSKGFFKDVYAVVSHIPAGKVMTYGQIALVIGRPRAARTVGYAMGAAPFGLPCHRVVNRLGEMAPGDIFGGAEEQRKRLESEGVTFLPSGRIDLKKHLWSYI
jgi:methylated-DNA-protein-cysteine methyltransferase-like protein